MDKNKSKKTAQIKHQPHKMNIVAQKNEKSRLVITCTEEEKVYVKMLAAKERMTISEYLLSFPRKNMPKPRLDKLTKNVLRESERGENLEHHETIDDFWKSMGIDPNAED